MSLPGNTSSSTPVYGPLLYPDNLVTDGLRDFEMGGVALNDPSQGLQFQAWTCWAVEASGGWEIRIMPLEGGTETTLLTVPDVQALSFSFDRNMNPTVAWMEAGVCKLWWYDSTIPGFTTSTFAGATQPRLAHDDKRENASARSDVILGYVRDGNLYYRQQRDRYTVERLLAEDVGTRQLRNIGMNTRLRFQFEMR